MKNSGGSARAQSSSPRFPIAVGQYHVVKHESLSAEQVAVLRGASRAEVDSRLAELIAAGKVAVSTVVEKYHDLLGLVEGD